MYFKGSSTLNQSESQVKMEIEENQEMPVLDNEFVTESEQRLSCENCERPKGVCWCQHVPNPTLKLARSKIIILQHPNERKKAIRTAKMLEQGLDSEDCYVFVRRKVTSLEIKDNLSSEEKCLRTWLSHPGAHVLFPKAQ